MHLQTCKGGGSRGQLAPSVSGLISEAEKIGHPVLQAYPRPYRHLSVLGMCLLLPTVRQMALRRTGDLLNSRSLAESTVANFKRRFGRRAIMARKAWPFDGTGNPNSHISRSHSRTIPY